ncbi:MAG TPA: hypothetical protein VK956_14600, partial [Verrucomicrobium sp.]|nr:hypothetical protein [Verrucomicrobium sp.]
ETALRDGWGNFIRSLSSSNPPALLATEYARLRSDTDVALTEADQEVVIVRHLGADGTLDNSANVGSDRDRELSFGPARIEADVKACVNVVEEDGSFSELVPEDKIVIRIFGPSKEDASKIDVTYIESEDPLVTGSTILLSTSSPAPPPIPSLTIGHRVVRAYLQNSVGTRLAASAVKNVVLQPGVNSIHLTIYR